MKKIVSSLLALSIICTASARVFAEIPINNSEKILNSVKSRITIPSGYDTLLSSSYTDANCTEYAFSWQNGEGEKAINVTANENGIISSYRYTDDEDLENQKPCMQRISPLALYRAACRYIRMLNPDIYSKLRITFDANEGGVENDTYYFDIQRYENNIPVDGNSGYIAISSDGKVLKEFSLTYTTGVEFEKADNIISREEAQKAYADKIGFVLCYGSKFDNDKIVPVPMYTTNNDYAKYISAVSGNPVKLNDIRYVSELSEETQGAASYFEVQDEDILPRINELKGMNDILSEKQAEMIVRNNKIINIPKNYILKNISGTKASDDNKCFYTLLFVGAASSDYVEVMMNAKNGEIVNFNRMQNGGKNKITKEEAKNIAKNAAAYLAPEHINDYILDDSGENGTFTFIRTVDNVEFSANQINIYIDMTNGNIVWYDYSYDDIKFPSLENVIPPEKISKAFFENSEYTPVYVLNCSKQGMTKYDKATLVYKFGNSNVLEVNAITGKALWNSTEESVDDN